MMACGMRVDALSRMVYGLFPAKHSRFFLFTGGDC